MANNHAGIIFICVIGILALAFVCFYGLCGSGRRRTATDADLDTILKYLDHVKIDNIPRKDESIKEAMAKDYRRITGEMVKERLEYEAQTRFGQPVWVSMYASKGQFRHWALITGGWKYELRKTTPTKKQAPCDSNIEAQATSMGISGSIGARYVHSSSPYTIDDEMRRIAIETDYNPIVVDDKHGIKLVTIMIGWTRKSREGMIRACEDAWQSFGSYNLLFNNCQHFLRAMAERVVETKSRDWDYFYQSTVSTYRWMEPPPDEPPDVMAAAWLRRMEDLHKDGSPETKTILQTKIDRLRKYIKDREKRFTPGASDGGGGGGSYDGGGGGGTSC